MATLHTLTSLSYEPLMMCWPSGVTATALTDVGVPLEGVDERPVDVVQPDLASMSRLPRPTTKCTPSGSAATRARAAHLEGALESAVERPQLRGAVAGEPLTKRAPPGSIATAPTP